MNLYFIKVVFPLIEHQFFGNVAFLLVFLFLCAYFFHRIIYFSPIILPSERKKVLCHLLCVFTVTFIIYFCSATFTGYLNPAHYAYFPELSSSWLAGKLYLVEPESTLDLTYRNGHWYLAFPPLPSLILLPFIAVFGKQSINTSLFTILFASANINLAYLFLVGLRNRKWINLNVDGIIWLCLFFGFSTAHWYLGFMGEVWFIEQILAITLIGVAACFAVHYCSAWLAGVCLAISILARPSVVLNLIFVLGILWQIDHNNIAFKRGAKFKRIIPLLIPILVSIIGYLFYNYIRFNRLLDFGYADMNVGLPLKDVLEKYGQFNWVFIRRNLSTMIFGLPYINHECNLLVPDAMGMSLLITSPAIIIIIKSLKSRIWVIASWYAIIATLIPILTYYNTGWVQFGYRFSLDFIFPQIGLMALGYGTRISRLGKGLIIVGVFINFIGVCWITGHYC